MPKLRDKDSPYYVKFLTINQMETNQNPVQENPAQRIAPELGQPSERLYDPNEAEQIVQTLLDGYFDPEYIL